MCLLELNLEIEVLGHRAYMFDILIDVANLPSKTAKPIRSPPLQILDTIKLLILNNLMGENGNFLFKFNLNVI